MSIIEVAVAGRGIQVNQGYEKPSAGDVNTCQVSLAIESGGVWDALPHKRVTFATRTASVTVDYAPTIAIPHEVMASPGALYLTLTGYDADGIEVARTHRMTYPIEVARAGADEGAEPSPATLDVVSRIDALAADLEEKRDTDYWRGEPGPPGDPGKDADIAGAEAAKNAANESATLANEAADNANETANQIKQRADSGEFNGSDGYSPTANVTKDGGTATITVTDKNGTTTATVSDGAPGKDGSDATATDVRINGNSITADGVADIPASVQGSGTYGVVKLGTNSNGIRINGIGELAVVDANNRVIDIRSGGSYPITTQGFDYAVKAAMCDGKGAAWTVSEKLAARERIGLGGDFELIEEITLEEDAVIVRTATPSGKQYAFSKILVDFIVPSQSDRQTYYVRFDNADPQPNTWTVGATGIELYFSQWAYCESGKIFQFAHGTATQNGRDSVNVLSSTRIPEAEKIEYLRIWAYKTGNNNLPAGTNIKIYGVWA